MGFYKAPYISYINGNVVCWWTALSPHSRVSMFSQVLWFPHTVPKQTCSGQLETLKLPPRVLSECTMDWQPLFAGDGWMDNGRAYEWHYSPTSAVIFNAYVVLGVRDSKQGRQALWV